MTRNAEDIRSIEAIIRNVSEDEETPLVSDDHLYNNVSNRVPNDSQPDPLCNRIKRINH